MTDKDYIVAKLPRTWELMRTEILRYRDLSAITGKPVLFSPADMEKMGCEFETRNAIIVKPAV